MTDAQGQEIIKDSRLAPKRCEVLSNEGIVISSGEVIPKGTVILLPYAEVIAYASKVALASKPLTQKYR